MKRCIKHKVGARSTVLLFLVAGLVGVLGAGEMRPGEEVAEPARMLHWAPDDGGLVALEDASGNGHGGALLRMARHRWLPETFADAGVHGAAMKLRPGNVAASMPMQPGRSWSLAFWMREQDVPAGGGRARFVLQDLVGVHCGERLVLGPWHFRKDVDDVGVAQQWHSQPLDEQWSSVRVPAFLSETEVGSYHGYGWYRTTVFVSDEEAKRAHELHFGGVDEQAWVYVNGELVGEHTTASEGMEPGEIWDRPFGVVVDPEHLQGDADNVVAVRTHASGGEAGIHGPVVWRQAGNGVVDLLDEADPLQGVQQTAGRWEHVALVVDDDEATLYLNGIESARTRWDTRCATDDRVQFRLGPARNASLSVLIDDVRVYAEALDAPTVSAFSEGLFHPEADWVRALDEPMRMLVRAGRWAEDEAEQRLADFQALGAPDVSALTTTLTSASDREDRVAAAWALGVYRDPQAIPALSRVLDSPQRDLADAASDALLKMFDAALLDEAVEHVGVEAVVASLRRILRSAPAGEVSEAAATGLADLGEAGVAELREAMGDGTARVRVTAQRALESAGHDASRRGGPEVVKNPYADVNWDAVTRYKANLHSHTVKSDGRAEPDQLIRAYADVGYDILAITDHDNYHTHREGERKIEPTAETTWPWTRWIEEEPTRIRERNGRETSAFYPELGHDGMLAVRGNELTQHPHIASLFNTCGWLTSDRTEDQRMGCVASQDGLAYWAHPSDYVPGGRWENVLFDGDWEKAVEYFGRHIINYEGTLGIELQLGGRKERDLELLDQLLAAYYREHDVFIVGNDDNHGTSVSRGAAISLVLAEELTEESLRDALSRGHNFVGTRAESYPDFNRIDVENEEQTIVLDVGNFDQIRWIKNGREHATGSTLDFSGMEDAIVRFEIEQDGATFYSQAFYIW